MGAESIQDGVGNSAESIVDGVLYPLIEESVPYMGKIADITHADTNHHTLDVKTALGEDRDILQLAFTLERISGTGVMRIYPNEHATKYVNAGSTMVNIFTIPISNNLLEYSLSVINDDFDLWCCGYVRQRN